MTSENQIGRREKCKLFRGAASLSPEQNRVLNIFSYSMLFGTFAAMLGIILYYVYAFASLYHGNSDFNWLLGIFSDFVSIMNAALADSPYLLEDGASYPAIAILVLYPFAWICRSVFSSYAGIEGMDIDELTSRVIRHSEFWVALVLFFLICISSILIILIKKYKLGPIASLKAAIAVITSAPFVYAIMRGNTIYFALIFLLLFLLLYDSPKAWVREIAYLCLALAGSIKIYPLFFGVFLLRKKKIFASCRVAVYFGAISLIAFYFFPAGMGDFDVFLDNLGGFMSDTERLLSMRNLSASSLLYKLVYLFSPAATETTAFNVVNLAILILIFLVASVTAVASRSRFSRSVIASAVVILIPTISYFYVLIFQIIPFMEYLMTYGQLPTWKKRLYGCLFMFQFLSFFLLPQCFIPHALTVIVMMVLEEKEAVSKDLIPFFQKKASAKAE
ncbi:MAG: DUF2029 domain-containing protein [Clostridia bacterium]|nr:DUF2029 domain-containing protein [Clostridia bacterium]